MQLTSPAFVHEGFIPDEYGKKNIHPELAISQAPTQTISFALIVHDPDGWRRDFLHWIVWNIPAHVTTIEKGADPESATVGINDMGVAGYMRPAPPARTGVHHYFFELYALDAQLNLQKDASRSEIETEIAKHTIAKAVLVGLFSRQPQGASS